MKINAGVPINVCLYNKAMIGIAKNPIDHDRTKHAEIEPS